MRSSTRTDARFHVDVSDGICVQDSCPRSERLVDTNEQMKSFVFKTAFIHSIKLHAARPVHYGP